MVVGAFGDDREVELLARSELDRVMRGLAARRAPERVASRGRSLAAMVAERDVALWVEADAEGPTHE